MFITLSGRFQVFVNFCSTGYDNDSIVGSITSPLLSVSFKEYGFSDISTHICSRLKNDSSSTSSNYRYTIFGHYLMCSIDANRCNMLQHIKVMTSSNTAASGLDLRCRYDSNLFYSIDSCQMFKVVCASQEYFQWDIFLTFTYNMRYFFGTKPICEWIYDNKWTIYFTNGDTYFSFCSKKYKELCINLLWTYF